MTFSRQRSKQHQGGVNRTCQADSLVISENTNLKKLLVVGREKGSILQDSVKCVLHIRSEVRLDTFVNSALFRITKGLVLRSTIQWRTTKTIYRQFLHSQAQEHNLQFQNVSKNILWGWTFKPFKTSGNWGFLKTTRSTKCNTTIACFIWKVTLSYCPIHLESSTPERGTGVLRF